MFGPGVTTKLILHSQVNNTAEILVLPGMRVLVFSMIPSMLLVFAWAQFMLALVYSLDCLDNSYC